MGFSFGQHAGGSELAFERQLTTDAFRYSGLRFRIDNILRLSCSLISKSRYSSEGSNLKPEGCLCSVGLSRGVWMLCPSPS